MSLNEHDLGDIFFFIYMLGLVIIMLGWLYIMKGK